MIAVWIGATIAAVVLLLALSRPVLARMGHGYAVRRPKQTAAIIVGLMITSTVIAASGIAADSASASFAQSLFGRTGSVDGVVYNWAQNDFVTEEVALSVLDDPVLDGLVEDHALLMRATLTAEADLTGIGSNDAVVAGIDPASFGRVTEWEAAAGTLPTSSQDWRDGDWIVNQAMAGELRTDLGDAVTLYTGGELIRSTRNETFTGHINASADLFGTGGVPIPEPVQGQGIEEVLGQTAFQVDVGAHMIDFFVRAHTDADIDIDVMVEVDGDLYRNETQATGPEETVSNNVFADVETLNISVSSPVAVDADFVVEASWTVEETLPPDDLGGRVSAIIDDTASDVTGGRPVILVPIDTLRGFMHTGPAANTLLLQMDPDTDWARLDEPFRDAAHAAWSTDGRATTQAYLVQAELQDRIEQIEAMTRITFLGLGSFSIIAGFLLMGVLMALLVEERKRVLGTMRAIGARRGQVTTMHAHEGSAYAGAAAVAGILGAVLMVTAMGGFANRVAEMEGDTLVLVLHPMTLLSAVSVGFSVTLLVLAWAAHRVTRIDPAAALRGEEQEVQRGRVGAIARATVVTLAGALVSLAAVATGEAISLVLGPCLLFLGLGMVLGRTVGRHIAYPAAASLVLVYVTASFWFIGDLDSEWAFMTLPLRGVLFAIAASILVAYAKPIHAAVAWTFGRLPGGQATVEAGLSHLRARPGRAAMTMGILSTTLLIITTMSTLFAIFQPEPIGDAGGYDVLGHSSQWIEDPEAFLVENPPKSGVDPLSASATWVHTPWMDYGAARFETEEADRTWRLDSRYWYHGNDAVAVTPDLAEQGRFPAAGLMDRYDDMQAALKAVAQDPGLAVAGAGTYLEARPIYYEDSGTWEDWDDVPGDRDLPIGQRLTMDLGETSRTVQVVGIMRGVGVAGLFMHPDLMEEMDESRYQEGMGTRFWADPPAGMDAEELAGQYESGFRRAGVDAFSVESFGREEQQVERAFTSIITIFLGLGIIIGVVSLGLITARSVIARRPEIGVLRAMGGRQSQVWAVFGVETLYIIAFAILIGLVGGIVLAEATLVADDELGVDFVVDWGTLGMLYGITAVAAGVASFLPAWSAARTPPAQAVRHVE